VETGLRLINASFYHIKGMKDGHQYETEELDLLFLIQRAFSNGRAERNNGF